jgi:16S rRNA pseudouridine516 synthase
LIAAGRLDKWASGLVVLSQDHKFVQRLSAPKVRAGALGKVYHVQLMNDLTGNEANVFASGKLVLRSETKELKPAKIEIIDPQEKLVQMTLYEGRYHQIRRMLAAVKNKAVSIHRVQVGPVSLGNLPVA